MKLATRYKNCSRLTPRTMASVDAVAASHPYLPCRLVVVCLVQAGWQQGGHGMTAAIMVVKCIWWLILLVFCVLFNAGVVIMAENRLLGTINDNIF